MKTILRWCWCQVCGVRTDQERNGHGWRCRSCGRVLNSEGEILEYSK